MLVVDDLTLAYAKRQPVVKQVSFVVPAGQFVAVLGPNGSGKSTLLRALCRLHPPLDGSISYGDRNLSNWKQKELAQQLAFVRQSSAAAFDFTVEQLVLFGRMPYLSRFQAETAHDYAVMERYLRLTGLWEMRHRGLHSLSGGELQRAFVCQALVQEPRVLLLDEPTNHLDINYQLELLDLVSQLNQEQSISVIAVLHDLNLAALYAERLLILKEGRLLADGSPQEVLQPQIVEQTYGCAVSVLPHPVNQRPQILLLPQIKRDDVALV